MIQSYCQLSSICASFFVEEWMNICRSESADPLVESLLMSIPSGFLLYTFSIVIWSGQVQYGNVTADKNMVTKFGLEFQVWCSLSIVKEIFQENKNVYRDCKCLWDTLSAYFTNVFNN